jgi:dTDP-4-amino-4,6-dideoxygalactose transaminase
MIVHWGGYPCDLMAFNFLGKKYNVKIIEDAAHAFGASYYGRKIGSHSDFVCFSFQAIKHLTTIDGGAVVTREESDWKRGKLLRWFGIDREQPRKDFRCEENVKEAGYKYHMNDVNATVGIHNIEEMNQILSIHQDNGTYYDKFLRGIPGITLLKRNPNVLSSYWIYTLLVDNRIGFMEKMTERGISTSQVHSRNDHHDMFANYRCPLPGVDAFTAKQVNIPVGWWVDKDIKKYIEDTIRTIKGTAE